MAAAELLDLRLVVVAALDLEDQSCVCIDIQLNLKGRVHELVMQRSQLLRAVVEIGLSRCVHFPASRTDLDCVLDVSLALELFLKAHVARRFLSIDVLIDPWGLCLGRLTGLFCLELRLECALGRLKLVFDDLLVPNNLFSLSFLRRCHLIQPILHIDAPLTV